MNFATGDTAVSTHGLTVWRRVDANTWKSRSLTDPSPASPSPSRPSLSDAMMSNLIAAGSVELREPTADEAERMRLKAFFDGGPGRVSGSVKGEASGLLHRLGFSVSGEGDQRTLVSGLPRWSRGPQFVGEDSLDEVRELIVGALIDYEAIFQAPNSVAPNLALAMRALALAETYAREIESHRHQDGNTPSTAGVAASHPVHDHGPREGRGLDCPEKVVDGHLAGFCVAPEAWNDNGSPEGTARHAI